jgi:hypothetical protein
MEWKGGIDFSSNSSAWSYRSERQRVRLAVNRQSSQLRRRKGLAEECPSSEGPRECNKLFVNLVRLTMRRMAESVNTCSL